METMYEVPYKNYMLFVGIIQQNLHHGYIKEFIAWKPLETLGDLLSRAEKYIQKEESVGGTTKCKRKEEIRDGSR